jgi:hypothetical protein
VSACFYSEFNATTAKTICINVFFMDGSILSCPLKTIYSNVIFFCMDGSILSRPYLYGWFRMGGWQNHPYKWSGATLTNDGCSSVHLFLYFKNNFVYGCFGKRNQGLEVKENDTPHAYSMRALDRLSSHVVDGYTNPPAPCVGCGVQYTRDDERGDP